MDLDLIGVTVSSISVIQPIRPRSLVDLEWSRVDFKAAVLHVRRAKNRKPTTHPLRGDEMRALRKLQREQAPASPFIFTSERGSPFSTAGFAKMIERAGAEAGFDFKAHPHMLRYTCGFTLANAGHDTRALQAYLRHPLASPRPRGSASVIPETAEQLERPDRLEPGAPTRARNIFLPAAVIMVPACAGLQWEYGCASLTDLRGAASGTSFLRNFTGHRGESRVDDHNSDRNGNYRTIDISRSAATVASNRPAGTDKICNYNKYFRSARFKRVGN
jgi:Phage integrase family